MWAVLFQSLYDWKEPFSGFEPSVSLCAAAAEPGTPPALHQNSLQLHPLAALGPAPTGPRGPRALVLSGRRGLEFQSPPKCDDTAFDSLVWPWRLARTSLKFFPPAVTQKEATPPFASAPGIGAKREEWEDGVRGWGWAEEQRGREAEEQRDEHRGREWTVQVCKVDEACKV